MDEKMDLEKQLSDCQCHFNWHIHDTFTKLDCYVSSYNRLGGVELAVKRFQSSLNLAYWMFIKGLDGWDKLLENSFRLMKHSRDPSCPQGLDVLPSYGSPLYAGSTQAFFDHDEVPSETNDHDMDTRHTFSQNNEDDDDEEDDILDSYVALEHVFYALKASILFRIGSSSSLVHQQLSRVTHFDDMTPSDRARVLFFKANAVQHTQPNGWGRAVDIMKTCVHTDPDSLKWPVLLIRYLGEKRRGEHRIIDESEIQNTVEVIDFVLQQDIKPSLRLMCQFEKLQGLNELRFIVPQQKQNNMFLTCLKLCEELEHSSKRKALAYCAQFYSKLPKSSGKAVQLIEKALEKSDPGDIYVNAKASNVYRNLGDLNKALECAEKAATHSYGSCMQVFSLKLDLKEVFDYEEFFCELIKNFPKDIHLSKTYKAAASFYMIKGDTKLAMKHFKLLLDMCDSEDGVYVESYCNFSKKRFHLPEAMYSLVLSSDFDNDNASVEDVALCRAIKGGIEEKFDVDSFKSLKHQTPKEYLKWLRSSSKSTKMDKWIKYSEGEQEVGTKPRQNSNRFGARSQEEASLSDHQPRQTSNRFGARSQVEASLSDHQPRPTSNRFGAHSQEEASLSGHQPRQTSNRFGARSQEAPQEEASFDRHPHRLTSNRFGASSHEEASLSGHQSRQTSNRFGARSHEEASLSDHQPRQTSNRFGAHSQEEASLSGHQPRQTSNRFGARSQEASSQEEASFDRHPHRLTSNRFGPSSHEEASLSGHQSRQTSNRFGARSHEEASLSDHQPRQTSNRFGAHSQEEASLSGHQPRQTSNRFGARSQEASSQEEASFDRHPPRLTSNRFGARSQEEASLSGHQPRQTSNRFGARSEEASSQEEASFDRHQPRQTSSRFGARSQEGASFGRHPPQHILNRFEDPSRRDPHNYANNMAKFFQNFDGSYQKNART